MMFSSGVGISENFPGTRYPSVPKFFFSGRYPVPIGAQFFFTGRYPVLIGTQKTIAPTPGLVVEI